MLLPPLYITPANAFLPEYNGDVNSVIYKHGATDAYHLKNRLVPTFASPSSTFSTPFTRASCFRSKYVFSYSFPLGPVVHSAHWPEYQIQSYPPKLQNR